MSTVGKDIDTGIADTVTKATQSSGTEILDFLVSRAFPNVRFYIEIDGIEVASFSSCSGVNVEVETFSYEEGGLNNRVHTLPTRVKYSPITLKRGMNYGTELYDWFLGCLEKGTQPERKNVVIKIYGHLPLLKLREITLVGAWPTKYTGADLSTENGTTSVESLEFVYDSFLYGGMGRLASALGKIPAVLP